MKKLLVFLVILSACATTPTGRKQLLLLNNSQVSQMGAQSFAKLKQEKPMSRDPFQNRVVGCITQRLLIAMGENPRAWEIGVFQDNSPNAFALPGNKMGIHTGMIRLVKNQDQLAAVIGHEIGHVLARHGNERMSQATLTQVGLSAAQVALGQNRRQDQMILAALGIGAQVGVLLPFGRKQETEADRLGLKYMAEAGFDPRQAAELWKLMARSGGGGPPEFLSTHPSPRSRINDLSARAANHFVAFRNVSPKPNCWR